MTRDSCPSHVVRQEMKNKRFGNESIFPFVWGGENKWLYCNSTARRPPISQDKKWKIRGMKGLQHRNYESEEGMSNPCTQDSSPSFSLCFRGSLFLFFFWDDLFSCDFSRIYSSSFSSCSSSSTDDEFWWDLFFNRKRGYCTCLYCL